MATVDDVTEMRQGPPGAPDDPGPARPPNPARPQPLRPQPRYQPQPRMQPPYQAQPDGPQPYRMTGRQVLLSLGIGLLLAVLASGATGAVMASRAPTYLAQTQIALAPAPSADPTVVQAEVGMLAGDQPGRTAAAVLTSPSMIAAAARAAKLDQAGVAVTTTPTSGTGIVMVDVRAATSDTAVAFSQQLVEVATPQIQAVSGPFVVQVVSPPADGVTVVSPVSVLAVAAAGVVALFAGAAATALLYRMRTDRQR